MTVGFRRNIFGIQCSVGLHRITSMMFLFSTSIVICWKTPYICGFYIRMKPSLKRRGELSSVRNSFSNFRVPTTNCTGFSLKLETMLRQLEMPRNTHFLSVILYWQIQEFLPSICLIQLPKIMCPTK